MSTERVIVQKEVSDELIDTVTALAKNIRAGNKADSQIPALTSKEFVPRVLSLIQDAKDRGGQILVGDITAEGSQIKPHIVLGVEPGWPLWDQESFGPVFGIKVVDTEEEAVALANATDYSLTAAIWTKDLAKGMRLGRQVRAGAFPFDLCYIIPYHFQGFVQINGPTLASEPGLTIRGLG